MWSLEANASAYPVFQRRIAVFERDFRRGKVYVELTRRDLAAYPYPLSAPLDRVLFVNIVTHGLGLMLHACGIVQNGKGYIFAGPSNAGKSTLSRLWAKASEATILGDECLVLRKEGSQFCFGLSLRYICAELAAPFQVSSQKVGNLFNSCPLF